MESRRVIIIGTTMTADFNSTHVIEKTIIKSIGQIPDSIPLTYNMDSFIDIFEDNPNTDFIFSLKKIPRRIFTEFKNREWTYLFFAHGIRLGCFSFKNSCIGFKYVFTENGLIA